MQKFNKQAKNSSWIELNSDAFKNNVSTYRKILGDHVLFGCVLKGNAYGHGFFEMLSFVYENPVDLIFVINPYDAFSIRDYEHENNHKKRRVIVLGALVSEEVFECAQKDIEVSLGDEHLVEQNYFEHFKMLDYAIKSRNDKIPKLKIHLHVDTGLGREGVRAEHMDETLAFFKKHSDCIHIQGIMSHFANMEDVTDQSYAKVQLDALDLAYNKIIHTLQLSHKPEKHIAQSAATLILPRNQYDIVRVGISLYGHWSSSETKLSCRVLFPELPNLKPVLTWKTKSQAVKEITADSFIGYGCSYRTDRNIRVAILPVGYYDGYPRSLSNIGHVLVNGKRCKIVGRVMMNHCIVDVTEATHDNAPITATLIGHDGEEYVSSEMLASWSGSIQYEILTRIGAHLTRRRCP